MEKPKSTPRGVSTGLSPDYQRDWRVYFKATSHLPPRDTLCAAASAFERESGQDSPGKLRIAIDIACGAGRDTHELLERPLNWRVFAVDSAGDGLNRLHQRLTERQRRRLTRVRAPMEGLANGRFGFPRNADLINASFALPFCKPESFGELWAWIVRTLRPGGRFSGQIFGDRDEWAPIRPASHRTREQALRLFDGFDLERFDEVEKVGCDGVGGKKQHHIFHIVARKKLAQTGVLND